MSDELPQGWAEMPVAEVIEDYQPGFASGQKNVEGGVAHLRMNNIGLVGELVLDLIRTVPEKLARPRHALVPGDVLVCTTNSGALVGKCAYFDLAGRYAFSNHLTRLRPKRGIIDGRFLRWNLWLHWKRGTFDDKCKHWVNQSTLPKDALLDDEVVVPPLAEQRRIVAKLEKLLGQVGSCQHRLAKMPTLLKRFRQSILAAACSGRLTADWRKENSSLASDVENDLPGGWQQKAVGDVIESLKYGTAQKCSQEKHGVPVLRIPNIVDGIISHSGLKYADLPAKEFQQLQLRTGDILLIRSNGSVSLVGKCALVRDADRDFAYAGYLIRLRPDAKRILPEFLNLVLGSYDVRKQIEIPARSTSGVNNINSEEVRALQFSLPLLPEQQEIVRRVESLFALADQLEARLAKAQAQVDKLTPSLLARAFAGKLVPQDPNDEPAEKLLARIKATQPKSKQSKP
jgi:type I restriction enzyme S subunit